MRDTHESSILVSVIIPTYRRSTAFVARAVESVRRQTHQNLEIMIIDDSTAAFAQRGEIENYILSLKDDRIQYIQNEKNCGAALSRNRGIFASTGDYITFLDDDDEYLPEKVEKQLKFMQEGSYDLTFSEMIMFSEEREVVDYRAHKELEDFSSEALLRYHLTKHLTGTPTYMYRAEKLKEIGGFDDAKVGDEFYLMAKSIQSGLRIGYFPECHVKVHKHSGESISSGTNKISGEKALYRYKKRFFDQLTADEKYYIRFRHYAVMVVAYKRNNMYARMIVVGIVAFLSSPAIFLNEVTGFVLKVAKQRKILERNVL